MTYTIIGTCGLCGGPVVAGRVAYFSNNILGTQEPPKCLICKTVAARPWGPVIPMKQETEAVDEKLTAGGHTTEQCDKDK